VPRTFTSRFSEPDDFQAVVSEEGVVQFLVTGHGQFRARLTQIALHRLRLAAGEEELSRIAFITVPASMVLVSFPIGGTPSPVWGGTKTRAGEIITLGPGERVHARTSGSCGWGAIQVPDQDLVEYGRALKGAEFAVPPAARWRPSPAAGREFRGLYGAAIRVAEARSRALIDGEAAHGLEQQLIHTLVECLSTGSADEETPTACRHRGMLARFEDLLHAQAFPRMTEICAALGISERTLRICCEEQLGMGPNEYVRRRRMQMAHRALRNGNPDAASISAVARRYGFHGLGRFAADYRALFGELPSTTLRQSSGQGMARLTSHRPPRRK
jgi:AraC-like DNA-binding protein